MTPFIKNWREYAKEADSSFGHQNVKRFFLGNVILDTFSFIFFRLFYILQRTCIFPKEKVIIINR